MILFLNSSGEGNAFSEASTTPVNNLSTIFELKECKSRERYHDAVRTNSG